MASVSCTTNPQQIKVIECGPKSASNIRSNSGARCLAIIWVGASNNTMDWLVDTKDPLSIIAQINTVLLHAGAFVCATIFLVAGYLYSSVFMSKIQTSTYEIYNDDRHVIKTFETTTITTTISTFNNNEFVTSTTVTTSRKAAYCANVCQTDT